MLLYQDKFLYFFMIRSSATSDLILPSIFLNGPRSCGKTTLVNNVCKRLNIHLVNVSIKKYNQTVKNIISSIFHEVFQSIFTLCYYFNCISLLLTQINGYDCCGDTSSSTEARLQSAIKQGIGFQTNNLFHCYNDSFDRIMQ